jgi:hypothetical protein
MKTPDFYVTRISQAFVKLSNLEINSTLSCIPNLEHRHRA